MNCGVFGSSPSFLRNAEVFDRSVDVHISALRKKLGDDPKTPRFIRTVRSAGYMWIDPDDA